MVQKKSELNDFEEIKEELQDKYNEVVSFVQRRPVESALIALGAGYVLGRTRQKMKDMFK